MYDLATARSVFGHHMSDAVQDLLHGYHQDTLRVLGPEKVADMVLQDLGFSKLHRLPKEARLSLVQWCRGVVENAVG